PVFAFLGVNGVPQADGSVMSLANAAWIWVPQLAIATIAAWSGMNDIASSRASIADQLPVLQRLHLWLLSLLYLIKDLLDVAKLRPQRVLHLTDSCFVI
ncbi:hypothetical protein PZH30_24485, partial [Escherichia coli]|nr:hypothetical protein [Escherichia coli]